MSLELTEVGYEELHKMVNGLRAAARDMAGMVPNHIWGRVHTLATKLEDLLYDEVLVSDTSDDGDGVDASRAAEQWQEMSDFERSHVNLEEGRI